ncbi:MAG: prohibitin family protein [Anaerolineaceae bacterium]|jgi:regulator of protease activity HflC (stomatin/prohibitin superfamily)|nr:prohibitin family protein [Anaerolineaceae bacterium]MDD4043707.1 prohibitin family protein [Anaerolineaceae bacterium]MDD4577695.1 prohibitin family protein [Anaerolineaceae bacterium]
MFDGNFTATNSTGNNRFKGIKLGGKVILGIIIALVLFILLTSALYEVPAGTIGVVTRFGAVNRVAYSGINLKIPFVERAVMLSIRTQKDEVQATAMSENLQVVTSLIAVNYHLDGNHAKEVYQNVGTNYADIIVAPAIQNAFKAVTARFSAEELITKRDEVRMQSEDELAKQLEPYFIVVENFNIVNFDFSAEYQNAIEAKQVAQQQVETSKQKLAQAEIDAQTVIAQAQGQADAQKALADTGALTDEYLQYLFLTRWNGILPQVMTSGSNSMIDVSRFMNFPQPEP